MTDCYHNLLKAATYLYAQGKCKDFKDGMESIKKFTGFSAEDSRDKNYARLTWDEYFMSLAFLVCMRSPDSQTQHGAVVVDKNNKILATGYNGYLPGAEDDCMPNLRPHKYQHIIHAEVNAILSAAQNLESCKIYITGLPCNECLKIIAKAGIKEVIVGDRMHFFPNGYFELQALICVTHEISIRKYEGSIAHLEGRQIKEASHEHA
jgi:dCMP deaminase